MKVLEIDPGPQESALVFWDAAGEKFYLGELCSRGHDHNGSGKSIRYRKNGDCLYCARFRAKRNKLMDPEKYRQWEKDYRKTEKGQKNRRESAKKWAQKDYAINPEKHREATRIWSKKHPEIIREKSKKRRETIHGQLENRVRRSIAKSLSGKWEGKSSLKYLGYSIDDLELIRK